MTTAYVTRSSVDEGTAAAPSRALLGVGLATLALFVGGMAVYGGGPGADDAAGAAAAMERTADRLRGGSLLIVLSMLAGAYVVAALSRAARPTTAGRLVLPLGAGALLLLAASFMAVSAAASVEGDLFGAAVSADAAITGLVLMNALMPLAGFVAAGFLVAAGASGTVPTWLKVTGYVFAVALLLPPVAWAVLYLVPLWLFAAAVALARRGGARR
jgi:hypothetical protein